MKELLVSLLGKPEGIVLFQLIMAARQYSVLVLVSTYTVLVQYKCCNLTYRYVQAV